MKSTLIVLPLTLATLSIETWINLRIGQMDSISQSNPESSIQDMVGSLTESIIDAIIRPEVLPSLILMLGCLLYADRNSHRFVEYMDKLSLLCGVFLFPLFILLLATYSLLDSLLIFSGSGSAIAWVRGFLESTFANDFVKDMASITIHFLIFMPLMLILAILIYGKGSNQKG